MGIDSLAYPKESPLLAKAEVILDLSGLPLATTDLATLLQRCHYPQHATPEITEKLLQSRGGEGVFLKLDTYWFLTQWVRWTVSKEQSLLDHMIEPEPEGHAPPSFSDPVRMCVQLLSSLGVAVSTGYLAWALGLNGIGLNPVSLCRDRRFLPVCGGHWYLRELVPDLVRQFSQTEKHLIQKMELQLQRLMQEADLKLHERSLKEEIQHVKSEAIAIISRRPASPEELCELLGLQKWVERATPSETERAKLLTIARSELLRTLDEGDLVQLPSGSWLKLSAQCMNNIIQYLEHSLCSLTMEEILGRVLQLGLGNEDKPVVLEALVKRLQHTAELEYTYGQWHLARKFLRDRLFDSISRVHELLQSSPAPVPFLELVRSVLGLSSLPQGVMQKVLNEVVEKTLYDTAGLWRLNSGCWWVLLEKLATDTRVQKLRERLRELPKAGIEELILSESDLRLEGLTFEERTRLINVFSQKIGEIVEEEPSHVPESVIIPPVSVPPRQTQFTLTREAITEGAIPITPGLQRMLSAYLPGRISELVTYGAYRLGVHVNPTKRRLEGRDIARWYSENDLQPGDIVYICAPEQQGEPLRLLTAFEMREKKGAEQKRPPSERQRIYLREQIYSILKQNSKVMSVGSLHDEVENNLGRKVNRVSVEATLSRETHLFVGWGKSYWGLREWGQDWRIRVDEQALLMRVIEEDLIFEILKDYNRWMTVREIAHEIARQFEVTTDFVLGTSFVDPSDPRLVRRGESWGLQEWTRPRVVPWLALLDSDHRFRLLVDNWLNQNWGLELGTLMKKLQATQKN